MASPVMNIAPIAKNIASRTRSSSVSSVSVSHEYAAQAHHTTARIISAAQQALPARVLGDERRDLRDGEHEHQVEEQLERGDRLLLVVTQLGVEVGPLHLARDLLDVRHRPAPQSRGWPLAVSATSMLPRVALE